MTAWDTDFDMHVIKLRPDFDDEFDTHVPKLRPDFDAVCNYLGTRL